MEHPYPGLPDVPPLRITPSDASSAPHDTSKCHDLALNALLDGIRHLRTDHASGAKELATQAAATLVQVAVTVSSQLKEERPRPSEGEDARSSEQWWEATRRAAWALSRYGRPSMGAAVTVAVVRMMDRERLGLTNNSEEQQSGNHSDDPIQAAVGKMQEYLQQRLRGTQSVIGAKLRDFILQNFQHRDDIDGRQERKILTLSSSSTIRQSLMTLLQVDSEQGGNLAIHLRIIESRPLCEGVDLARELVRYAESKGLVSKLSIELAPDASVAILARDVDIVLLGADRISATGDVSNKTGSLPAVLCAKAVSKHVTVVAISELEKIAKPGGIEEHSEEDNDVQEVVAAWRGKFAIGTNTSDAWEKMVKVRNTYFEWVPATYIDHYICERGLISADNIRGQSLQVLQAEKRLFGDLDQNGCVH